MAGIISFGVVILFMASCFQFCYSQNVNGEIKALKRKLAAQGRKINALSVKLNKLDGVKGVLNELPACPTQVQGFHYEENLRSCYKIESNSILVNVTEAAALCESYHPDSHLVSIESQQEQNFLRAMWKNQYGISGISRFWTSGKRRGNNKWVWSSNNMKIKYENWIPTTIHNNDNFLCLGVYSDSNYNWVDVACWAPHVVTCEIKLQ